MIDRNEAPTFKAPGKFVLPQPATMRLDNGVPLHIFNLGHVPVSKIEFIFTAGSWFEEKVGASFFSAKMLSEGSSKYTSNEIASIFDQYGLHFEVNPGPDYISMIFYANNRHLRKILPVVSDLIYQATFPQKELDSLKNIQQQQLKVNKEKNNFLAARLFKRQLFGDLHPYGKNIDEQHVNDLNRNDLIEFYRDNFSNAYEIILSGQINYEFLPLFNKFFGQQGQFKEKAFKSVVNGGELKSLEQEKPGSLQSSIKIGKRLFKKSHSDFIPLLLLNEVFGGYFGSRLMQNIRENKGYTYGIYSSLVPLKNDGYFIISTDAKKAYSKETVQEIEKELQLLAGKEIGKVELAKVKNYLKGSFLSGITTPFALADKFKSVHFYDLDYHFYDLLFDTIDSVKASELKALARKYLDFDTMTQIKVG